MEQIILKEILTAFKKC